MSEKFVDDLEIILCDWRRSVECYRRYADRVFHFGCEANEQLGRIVVAMMVAEFQRAVFSIYEWCVNVTLKPFSEVDVALASSVTSLLVGDSSLASGNPTVARIGKDFRRVGISIWPGLESLSVADVSSLKQALTQVLANRNLIVHGRDSAGITMIGHERLEEELFTPLDSIVTLICRFCRAHEERRW